MIRLLQRLLDPAYLYATSPGPLGQWGTLYVAWAALLAAGLGMSLWWKRRTRRAAAAVTAWACGLGLLFLGLRQAAALAPQAHCLPLHARFLLFEAWTARAWPISATLVAVLAPLGHVLSRLALPPLVQRQVDALACALRPQDPPLRPWQNALLAGLHLAGLGWLWHMAGRSPWWAVPTLLAFSLLPFVARPRRWRSETLAPLTLSYLAAIAYLLLSDKLGIDVQAYQGFALPDPLSPWFNVPAVVLASAAYTLLIQGWYVVQPPAHALPLPEERGRAHANAFATIRDGALPAVLVAAAALWLGSTVVIHRTHGVTASDPYCYVQMAIDLAKTGSPLHDYPLAGLAGELGLPTWPAVHIGYHPPFFENRSPTMWPIGWPLLMVPFYLLGGLQALYLVAPLISALALAVAWLLADEALRERPRVARWAAAALSVLLVATSPEGAERMLVPMADAAAQLFTLLTLWLLLRGLRSRSLLHGALAGASFGMAYLIRHPQLPLGLAALVAALAMRQPLKRRAAFLLTFGLAACAIALPDLAYHRAVFGGWLRTESSEWFLLSPAHIGQSFLAILQQGLLRREELGFIAPLALYGGWALWRRHPRPAWVLMAGFGAVFLFHLCYAALRPRDLIAILPILYLCAAYGVLSLWEWGCPGATHSESASHRAQRQTEASHRRGAPHLGRAAMLACALILLAARSYRTLEMPWRHDVITFGHVSQSQRQAFAKLAALTPEDAVIGSMLNGGAIELYAGRAAVHPFPWTEEELHRWIEALHARGRPFYLLDDGEEMPAVLARLRDPYRARPIQALDLPYFAHGGGNIPRRAQLYKIEP